MTKRKNKTALSIWGAILLIFGITGTIPIILNRELILGLPLAALAVIIGVILIGKALSD